MKAGYVLVSTHCCLWACSQHRWTWTSSVYCHWQRERRRTWWVLEHPLSAANEINGLADKDVKEPIRNQEVLSHALGVSKAGNDYGATCIETLVHLSSYGGTVTGGKSKAAYNSKRFRSEPASRGLDLLGEGDTIDALRSSEDRRYMYWRFLR